MLVQIVFSEKIWRRACEYRDATVDVNSIYLPFWWRDLVNITSLNPEWEEGLVLHIPFPMYQEVFR